MTSPSSRFLLFLLFPSVAAVQAQVLTGLDVLEADGFKILAGKRVGLITNQTGRNRSGVPIISILEKAPRVEIKAVFSPEHGWEGLSEKDSISSGNLHLPSGRIIPLYSLYGSTKAPTSQMLEGLDALVFDIQDIGARFYTYITTMGMAMESAAKAGIEFIVLDRPNPINGLAIEGAILSQEIRHFTAYYSIPARHGMTIGEIAEFHKKTALPGLNLKVVKMKGWERSMWYDQTGLPWTKPSPNMPGLDTATLYPGMACFESTNLSVGRGTPRPFLWVGAPWLNSREIAKYLNALKLPGAKFKAKTYTPSKSVYANLKCKGVLIRILDRGKIRPLDLFAHMALKLRDMHPKDFQPRWEELGRMVGNDEFRNLYESGASAEDILHRFHGSAKEFQKARRPYLLY